MIIRWGPTLVQPTLAGDVVSQRRVTFTSQPEQIRFLRGMVDTFHRVPAIRARARDIVLRQYSCLDRNQVAQAIAIGDWVQRNIRYIREKPETFQTPTTTVAMGAGDCDDHSTLIAAMCESIGIDTELVGLEWATPGTGERAFQHIFARAVVGGQRIPLDTTLERAIPDLTDPVAVAREKGLKVRLFVA